jgi:hypothetical protein
MYQINYYVLFAKWSYFNSSGKSYSRRIKFWSEIDAKLVGSLSQSFDLCNNSVYHNGKAHEYRSI